MPGEATAAALTRDHYLGGRLALWQPAAGYRAGVDAVFLAAACPARPGESVLELGCGAGTAILCLGARVRGLRLAAVERQEEMADLARRNAEDAGLALDLHVGDLADLPAGLRRQAFDHVIANPPYFDRGASLRSGHAAREAAMGEDTPLASWLQVAARRLRPKGWLTLIHRPARLADILAGLGDLGSVQIQPLIPRRGRDANLVLVRARKGGRAQLRLHAAVVLHEGHAHLRDGEDYTAAIRSVLREAAAFPGFSPA
ncbi:tRNA1(Val) (adenine(37)-N6)-methyltransferase [Tropicimonas sp. IMCC34043]|uniref:tRNA1(Val) (adenine(37)-N6)-methyltransferase n=1 Tax=Tropicimonas sp. IMCC34043 TaxID=2248760 RepID=UPI000E285387|nr:methyltransferase domain-containing protein [Tropicimonas sp. IMCC34043]